MQFSFAWTFLLCLTAAEAHASYHRIRDAGTLVVSLAASSSGKATEIQATITNAGDVGINALTLGTILDDKPVRKLIVVDQSGRP